MGYYQEGYGPNGNRQGPAAAPGYQQSGNYGQPQTGYGPGPNQGGYGGGQQGGGYGGGQQGGGYGGGQQGGYQQQAPPAPAQTYTAEQFYSQEIGAGAGINTFFQNPGQTLTMTVILAPSVSVQTNPSNGQPQLNADGSQRLKMTVPVSVPPMQGYEDGKAVLYIQGQARNELSRAQAEAGAPVGAPKIGDQITARCEGFRKVNKPGMNDARVLTFFYRPAGSPAPAPVTDNLRDPALDQPQGQGQQPPPQMQGQPHPQDGQQWSQPQQATGPQGQQYGPPQGQGQQYGPPQGQGQPHPQDGQQWSQPQGQGQPSGQQWSQGQQYGPPQGQGQPSGQQWSPPQGQPSGQQWSQGPAGAPQGQWSQAPNGPTGPAPLDPESQQVLNDVLGPNS